MALEGNWNRGEINRRALLGRAGMGMGALALYAGGFSDAKAWAKPFFHHQPFSLGVASGDPLPGGVVLWTRLAPEPLQADGGMPDRKVGRGAPQARRWADPSLRPRNAVHRACLHPALR